MSCGLLSFDTRILVRGLSVVYDNSGITSGVVAVLYVIASCGSLLFSGYRYIVVFGAFNLIGLSIVILVKAYVTPSPRYGVPVRPSSAY